MKDPTVHVLMLGEKAMAPSSLLARLLRKACECRFAASADDGIELFEEHKFQLILNTGPTMLAIRMLPALTGSECTVFSAFPVERGCWWLPIMRLGRECLGAPAMRTGEFFKVLDETLAQIRVKEPPTANSRCAHNPLHPLFRETGVLGHLPPL